MTRSLKGNKIKQTGFALACLAITILTVSCAILTQPSAEGNNLDKELHYLLRDFEARNPSVKNCVVYVVKGDGSFSWSGAAGLANAQTETPMTPATPIFIASITKLYSAAAVLRLYEQGKIALDNPLVKYLPEDLIKGIHVFEGKDYSRIITIRHLLSHSSGLPDDYT